MYPRRVVTSSGMGTRPGSPDKHAPGNSAAPERYTESEPPTLEAALRYAIKQGQGENTEVPKGAIAACALLGSEQTPPVDATHTGIAKIVISPDQTFDLDVTYNIIVAR
ncbi:hypothetical protein [Polyangium sp. 15x6]|uniref:hypothetical protein n=1 Tax=Polyangium sp. 15x6 TaxID=3042687 RepID=UPI00249BCD53|nr:hypothetical protein [Polyangium sp. 15x6]MDI3287318.1 hypothetical protein [Polyangium sp. 15x6]